MSINVARRLFILAFFAVTAISPATAEEPGSAGPGPAAALERTPLPTKTPNLDIMIVAHRGVKKKAPENTLPAIQKAIILGYDYVELDVRYAKDGTPVLMHDPWIDRTTSGFGPVSLYKVETLKKFDAGFWKGTEYIGTKAPTVEEALSLMQGRIKLYLDQKKPPLPELIRLMKEYGFYPDNIVVVGGSKRTKKFLDYEPNAPVMPGLRNAEEVDDVLERFPSAIAFNTSCTSLTADMVEEAHERGVMVFTNVLSVPAPIERECMRRPMELGSDAIQFDNVNLFFEVLEEMKRESAAPPEDPEFLCPDAYDPENAADKVHISCEFESGEFAPPVSDAGHGEFLVAAYNLERGMYLDQQIEVLKNHPDFKNADVLLISEADRGCSRVAYRNVARDLAEALSMDYVFGVQYVELPREADEPVNDNQTVCEHGNAVLSRFPIKNVEQIRHRDTVNWYIPPGPEREDAEPRLGGAITLAADIEAPGKTVRVYSVHLNSDITKEAINNRTSQARDLVRDAQGIKAPVIMGGDFNTINYTMDLILRLDTDDAVKEMRQSGFKDAHASLPYRKRGTTGRDYLVRGVIDLIFVRGAEVVDRGICEPSTCGFLSDHLPVWARVRVR